MGEVNGEVGYRERVPGTGVGGGALKRANNAKGTAKNPGGSSKIIRDFQGRVAGSRASVGGVGGINKTVAVSNLETKVTEQSKKECPRI